MIIGAAVSRFILWVSSEIISSSWFCILMQGAFCISIAYVLEIFIRLSEGYSIAVSLLNHIQCVSYFPMAFCLHLLGMWNVQASRISVDRLSPSDGARG